jgi:hypothetical protein
VRVCLHGLIENLLLAGGLADAAAGWAVRHPDKGPVGDVAARQCPDPQERGRVVARADGSGDLARFAATFGDLADPDVMAQAWQ